MTRPERSCSGARRHAVSLPRSLPPITPRATSSINCRTGPVRVIGSRDRPMLHLGRSPSPHESTTRSRSRTAEVRASDRQMRERSQMRHDSLRRARAPSGDGCYDPQRSRATGVRYSRAHDEGYFLSCHHPSPPLHLRSRMHQRSGWRQRQRRVQRVQRV